MSSSQNNLPNWKLPEEITRRLGSSSGKQRIIFEVGHLLLILHKRPEKHSRLRSNVYFWRNPEGRWEASTGGAGLFALESHIDDYIRCEEKLDERYNAATKAKDYFDILEELAPLQRSANNMHNALQAARECIGEELVNPRNKAWQAFRAFELLYTDTRNALEYSAAKKAEEQSELQKQALSAGHRLNVIMAVFFPITAIASVVGMNAPKGLENYSNWVVLSTIISGALLGLLIRSWVLKKPQK